MGEKTSELFFEFVNSQNKMNDVSDCKDYVSK